MSDEIKTASGQTVGSWNGDDISDLQKELDRIRQEVLPGTDERLVAKDMPHREQLPEDLQSFRAYPIWACDKQENCLCGARGNRVVSVEDVRQYSMIEHH